MMPRHPTAVAVIASVAAAYGIDADMIWGTGRGLTLCEARHLAWWALRERTGWSYPELARALGNNHTSVLHGVRKTCAKVLQGQGTGCFKSAVSLMKAYATPDDEQGTTDAKPEDNQEVSRVQPRESLQESRGDPGPTSEITWVSGVGVAGGLPAKGGPRGVNLDQEISDPDQGSSALISSDPKEPVSKRARGPKPRLRNVPETWAPGDAHRALAKQLGVDFEHQLAMFRDHEFRDPKSNFDAAFRTWLRRSHSFGTPPGKSPTFPQDNARRPELALFKPKAEPTETVSAAELDALAKRVTGRGTI